MKKKIIYITFAAVLLSAAGTAAAADYYSCRCGQATPGIDIISNCCKNNYKDVNGNTYGVDGDSRCCTSAEISAGKKWVNAQKACVVPCTPSTGSWTAATSSTSDTCNGDKNNAYTCASGARTCVDVISTSDVTAYVGGGYMTSGCASDGSWLSTTMVNSRTIMLDDGSVGKCDTSAAGFFGALPKNGQARSTTTDQAIVNWCQARCAAQGNKGTYICYVQPTPASTKTCIATSTQSMVPTAGCQCNGLAYLQRAVTCC
ncbi:MAG: hypothetical protein FWF35_01680 [Elusimicrobia bacterium]|nr:hypothetical protein [Elusimicrobiota bacterium]